MDWKAGQAAPFAFKRTGDADFPKHIKALVLGAPKSGKTSLLATFPNIVIADVEAGLMSIAHRNVPYVTIDQAEKLQTLLFVLRDPSMRAQAAHQMGLDEINSVGIDTTDALQDLFKRERLATEKRTQFEMKDWGWLLDQFRELIKAFVDLPMHVIFTCHTKTVQDDEGKTVTQPGLQGGIAEEIAGMVGFSMLMKRTREVDPQSGHPYTSYRLQVEGDDQNPHLGNRAMGRLSGHIEPTFDVLYKAIYEGLELAPQQGGHVRFEGDTTPYPESDPTPRATQEAQETGAPPSDDDQPVTSAALQHVEKMLGEWGFVLPNGVESWTMGFARKVARTFVSQKEDLAAGKIADRDTAREQLETYLHQVGAWQDPESIPPDGKVNEVLEWVGDDLERARITLDREKEGKARKTIMETLAAKLGEDPPQPPEPAKPEPEPAPEPASGHASESPEPESTAQSVSQEPVPETPEEPDLAAHGNGQAEDGAAQDAVQEAQAQEQAQGQAQGEEETEAEGTPQDTGPGGLTKSELLRIEEINDDTPLCEETGCPIDDLDIAKLALSRFGRWLSVDAYVEETKKQKA